MSRKKQNLFDQHWIQEYWRPIMAFTYTFICLWDFFIAPIFFQFISGSGMQWKPLTLEGAGVFHASMGAIIGVTAWTRGVEKQKFIENFEKISETKIDFNHNGIPDTEENVEETKPKKRSYKDVINGT